MQGFLVHINFGGSSFDQSTFFHLFCAKEAMCSFADCFKNSNEGRKVIIGDEEFQSEPPAFLLRRFLTTAGGQNHHWPQMFWTESRLILCKQLKSTSQNASSCVNYVEPHNLWVCFDAAFKLLQSSPLCCVHGTLRHSVVVQCSTYNTGCSQCCLFTLGN